MAEKKSEAKSDSTPDAAANAAKSGGKKFALITVALLLIEGGVLFAVFSMGTPKQASAGEPPAAEVEHPEEMEPVEVAVFEDRVYNDASGVTYQYKADIYLKVKPSGEKQMIDYVTKTRNSLRQELCGIFRTAEPQHFLEPLHETLRRRIESLLRERIEGKVFVHDDADKYKKSAVDIDGVVVVIGSGIRVNR